MKLQPNEMQALDEASLLVKFAAESPKPLSDNIVTPIAVAWKAREDDAWSPEISSKFWIAYSALCDLINPATLITISAGTPTIKSRRWILFGDPVNETLAQRTATRYRILLVLLLAIAILFGFVASTTTKLNEQINEQIMLGDKTASDAMDKIEIIKSEIEKTMPSAENSLKLSLDDPGIGTDTKLKITDLRKRLQDLYKVMNTIQQLINGIQNITWFANSDEPIKGDLSRLPFLEHGYNNIQDYYVIRRDVGDSQQDVFILNNLYNALVPMLFGAIGACTYVLRYISEQIRETTFSPTSPIRHSVRIWLGALTGFVVGLGGLVVFTNTGLTAPALAFLAGYAVEPVFAAMDGIAEKFRRP
jgi:hypothetical protein